MRASVFEPSRSRKLRCIQRSLVTKEINGVFPQNFDAGLQPFAFAVSKTHDQTQAVFVILTGPAHADRDGC